MKLLKNITEIVKHSQLVEYINNASYSRGLSSLYKEYEQANKLINAESMKAIKTSAMANYFLMRM